MRVDHHLARWIFGWNEVVESAPPGVQAAGSADGWAHRHGAYRLDCLTVHDPAAGWCR